MYQLKTDYSMVNRPVERPAFLNLWKAMFFVFILTNLQLEPRIVDIEENGFLYLVLKRIDYKLHKQRKTRKTTLITMGPLLCQFALLRFKTVLLKTTQWVTLLSLSNKN